MSLTACLTHSCKPMPFHQNVHPRCSLVVHLVSHEASTARPVLDCPKTKQEM